MNCHICNRPAIGQCQACWKFYCAEHGDRLCDKCAHPAKTEEPTGETEGPIIIAPWIVGAVEPTEGKILRVVPVILTRDQEGVEITIVSLELYDNGFLINYRLRDPNQVGLVLGRRATLIPILTFDVQNDLGQTYYGFPSAATVGPPGDWRGIARLGSAIEQGVRELRVRVTEIEWRSWHPEQKNVTQQGLWEFQIRLE
jgi:hypothetical protein